jgi:hypothetical protein
VTTEYSLPQAIYAIAIAVNTHQLKSGKMVNRYWYEQLDTTDIDLVIKFVHLVRKGCQRLMQLVSTSDLERDSKEAYQKALTNVSYFFDPLKLDKELQGARQSYLTPEVIAAVRGVRDTFKSRYQVERVDEQKLTTLQKLVEVMLSRIEEMEIDPFLKEFYKDELRLLRTVLVKFEMVGGVGIESCLGNLTIRTVRSRNILDKRSQCLLLAIALLSWEVIGELGDFMSGIKAIGEMVEEVRQLVNSEEFKNTVQPILLAPTKLLEYYGGEESNESGRDASLKIP